MRTSSRVPAIRDTLRHWAGGIRLYIGIAAVLATLDLWWWASVTYGGSALFALRLEEVYAWLALGLLGLAVSIGPLYGVLPKLPGKQLMRDGRRLFGVSAAWFASLHVAIAYVGIFKATNPFDLPTAYQQAFALGIIALLVLLAMAFTSFDKAFHGMGKWWFRLHRFVYLAVVFVLLHAFLVGVHAVELPVLVTLSVCAAVVLGLHGYLAFKRRKSSLWQLLTLAVMFILLAFVFHLGYHRQATISSDETAGAR